MELQGKNIKVAVLRSSSVANSARVNREVSSITKAGFRVLILSWDRETEKEPDESRGKIVSKKFRLKAPIGTPYIVIYFPLFWFWALAQLMIYNPLIIHACDFDTMPVALLAKMLRKRTRLIYDCFEYYPGMVQSFLTTHIKTLIEIIDRFFAKIADCVIVPSEERKIFYKGAKKIVVLPNVPKPVNLPNIKKPQEFTIFYGGGLDSNRGIINILKVSASLKDIQLILAGRGKLEKIIRAFSKKFPNITYLGVLSHYETLRKMAAAHITIAFYEASNLNDKYAASEKLFEAMMLGIPVITNEECISISNVVIRYKCGLVIPYNDIESLKLAILQLKNDSVLRKKLGENGRRAYEQKHNWNLMEKKLLQLYDSILHKTLKLKE